MAPVYRNVFVEAGISKDAVDQRLFEIKEAFFHGNDAFYHEYGDEAYLEDTGNHDARTQYWVKGRRHLRNPARGHRLGA